MDDVARVRQAVDRVLVGDLDPLLALLEDDVAFRVTLGGDTGLCREETGKDAVASYFGLLDGVVTFWHMDYTAGGDQLIAWGRESFTVEPCGLEASSEFALMFDMSDGLITRLTVVEDLPAFIRAGRSLDQISSTDEPEFQRAKWEPDVTSWEPEMEVKDFAVSGEFPIA
jgi:ketosteroid isomerase-like protein